jgi:serine/threonine-protein kinase
MFPQIFGKYVLEREIAAGGMARVFLATLRGAVGFEKRLVVKQIRSELAVDEAFVKRFVGEAKTAVELSHPNIVPVYELGVEQGVYYIAMEHCAGVTLAEVLAYTGPLDPEEGAYLGAEVCRALDYAHRRAGIVHRDVTPRNVLLDDEGGVRLIDFGIAAPAEAGLAERREVFGSPGHMPPEQLRGDALGPETDVFAVGTLLIEAWTGKAPFRRATNEASARALREPPPPLDATIPALAPITALVRSSVALSTKDRPADAEQLGRGLRDFLRSSDSVEVSRRLASRVRRAREHLEPDEPGSAPSAATTAADSTPPLVTPTGLTPTTATFAARDEIVEWTRRFSSRPPGPLEGPATRRLSIRPSAPPPEPRRRPVLFGALAVAAVGSLALAFRLLPGSGGARATAPAASSPMGAGPQLHAASVSRVPVSAASAVAVLEAATPVAAHGNAPPIAGGTAAPSHPVPRGNASARASTTAETPPSSVGERAPAAAERAPTPEATLRLTSDPPSAVSVEGGGFSQTSSTPVRALSLPAGNYRVIFRSETYGSPVATQVALAAGVRRSVHADFRAAVPTITVR